MSFCFTEKNLLEYQNILKQHPHKKASLVPVLFLAQKQQGFLSLDAQEYVAKLLDLPESHVHGVVTFSKTFKQTPVGKYHIQVCGSLCCALKGSEAIIHHLNEKHALIDGQISKNRLFSLEIVDCLSNCSQAPTIKVNNTFLENMSTSKLDQLMEKLNG